MVAAAGSATEARLGNRKITENVKMSTESESQSDLGFRILYGNGKC